MTGFRVAPGGVQQLYGITPDLTCMGKVIGGGLPVGAFGGRSESWTASLRLALCIRREPCPAIRSPWRRDWPSSGNS